MLAVADGEDEGVSRVALYSLEVLYEERLVRVFGEERFQVSVLAVAQLRQLLPQRGVDPLRVPDAERDDAQRLARVVAGVLEDQLHDLVDLGGDRRFLARSWALGHHDVAQAVVPEHARERRERATVDAAVGERDQPLVPAPVVPRARRGRERR